MTQENCELLIKAKALAIKRGLDSSKVECPFVEFCKGTTCYIMEDEGDLDIQDGIGEKDEWIRDF
jgi:hypothetical protein